MKKETLTNKRETDSYIHITDSQLSEGRGVGGLGRKGEGIKQKSKISSFTDSCIVITRGKTGWGI